MTNVVTPMADERAPQDDSQLPDDEPRVPLSQRVMSALSVRNISAIYVWALIIVVFSLWASDTFPTIETVKSILNVNAVTGLVALSLILPLAAGVFDLSVAYTVGLSSVTVAYLLTHGIPVVPAVILTLLVAFTIGVLNATIIVVGRIDSFIGTLATGALIAALTTFVSGDESIVGPELAGDFSQIARANIGGITAPVLYMFAVAGLLWFVLEHTVGGRHLYATGFGATASRLAGVRTHRLQFMTLLVSSSVAGIAGVAVTARITSGSPTVGPPFLLPAFAAAFLGATQIRPGRFNAAGTVVAVMLLGTGITGLSLAGAPLWAPDVFTGVTLLLALGATGTLRRTVRSGRSAFGRLRTRDESPQAKERTSAS